MKKTLLMAGVGLAAMLLLNGCLVWGAGDKTKTINESPRLTVGQQLLDLKSAHDMGAISDQEYADQKAKVLGHK